MRTRSPAKSRWTAYGLLLGAALVACTGPSAAPAASTPAVAAAGASAPTGAPAATLAPAAGLRLEGTPPVPDPLRDRLQQYLNTRSASLSDIADDGRSVLVATRFGDSNQVHLVASPGAARRQLTFSREPVRGGAFVPGKRGAAGSLIYVTDVGGNEQYQILRLDLESWRTARLTDGKSRNVAPVWSEDGTRLAWSSTARNGRDFDVWVSDGASGEGAALAVEGKGMWSPLAFSRDNDSLLIGEDISITHSRLHLADLTKKTVVNLTPGDKPFAYRDAVLAPDGKRAYVTSDREGEFVSLYELDIARASWRPLTEKIEWNVEDIALSGDGRQLAFTTNEGGLGRLYLLATRTRRARPVAGMPEGVPGGLVFARKAPVLGFSLASGTRTGDAYTYDLRRGKVTRWTESEMGGLDPARFVAPKLIEFKSFDGAKIPAFYHRPAGAGPFPVLIQIHGGPESQARAFFNPLIQYLASEAGIAVLEPNVRGSDGYGRTYLTLDNGMKREDSVKDIGALLDWIGQQKELDASRVAVGGGSYGGYMVLASLVHFGDRIKAGIDLVGISNFVTFLENTADYRRDLRRVEYGDERDPAMRKHLEAISPLNHVDRIKSALFVAQGANDPRVPASEAEQILRAVRKAGHDVWYMLAPDEGHGFAKKENRDTFTLLCILFLEKHLGGAVAGSPAQ
ncbi:MAG TPA: prolyl oligopeptidase family serine peptidase [Kofleriaceae bacterium]|nr:prolyl oligopeptidase family serine peptidase [Kofleriaceae bacterium]